MYKIINMFSDLLVFLLLLLVSYKPFGIVGRLSIGTS